MVTKTKKPAKKAVEKKIDKKMEKMIEDAEDEVEEIAEDEGLTTDHGVAATVAIKASKPISKIKKGDKMRVDGKEYEVDAHYVLIEHGETKEMAIELFDAKSDKDYQLRYFDDQVETTLDFYELQDILYVKRPMISVSW